MTRPLKVDCQSLLHSGKFDGDVTEALSPYEVKYTVAKRLPMNHHLLHHYCVEGNEVGDSFYSLSLVKEKAFCFCGDGWFPLQGFKLSLDNSLSAVRVMMQL